VNISILLFASLKSQENLFTKPKLLTRIQNPQGCLESNPQTHEKNDSPVALATNYHQKREWHPAEFGRCF
jgi:hypothetical protein